MTAVRWFWISTVVEAERIVVVGPSVAFWVPLTTLETSS